MANEVKYILRCRLCGELLQIFSQPSDPMLKLLDSPFKMLHSCTAEGLAAAGIHNPEVRGVTDVVGVRGDVGNGEHP